MREQGAGRIVPLPSTGRVHEGTRRVRFGDIGPTGGLRLDALAAYLQDLSSDDTVEAGLGDDPWWVVRRAVVEVRRPGTFREVLTLRTACSGLGSRWAERRVSVTGESGEASEAASTVADGGGAVAEAATLWVRLDAETGKPAPLDERFLQVYGPAAGARVVHARLQHDPLPPADATPADARPADATRWRWPIRYADLDPLGHVNNAASWAIVEEILSRAGQPSAAGHRFEVEFRRPIEPGDHVDVVVAPATASVSLPASVSLDWWAVDAAAASGPYLTGRIRPLP